MFLHQRCIVILSAFFALAVVLIVPPLLSAQEQTMPRFASSTGPLALTYAGSTGGLVQALVVSDTLAYLGEGAGMRILDVTVPAQLIARGYQALPDMVADIALDEHLAYIATTSAGIQIVDVHDPHNPLLVGSYATPGHARSIAVQEEYAYVLDTSVGVLMLDVQNPASPVLVGQYETLLADQAQDIAVDSATVYIAAGTAGVQILDSTDRAAPVLTGSIATPGQASYVAVADGFIYVADGFEGLSIVDARDPVNPNLAGSFDISGNVAHVQIVEHYAFVCAAWAGLLIVDVSDPSQPSLVAEYDAPDDVLRVSVLDDVAFLATDSGIQAVDIQNMSRPDPYDSYVIPSTIRALAVGAVDEEYAFAADSVAGLLVVDIPNIGQPVITGVLDMLGDATAVQVAGSYAFVADGTAGLQVIDMRQPTRPKKAGSLALPGDVADVVLADNYAFVAAGWAGLMVVDIEDPASPMLVGTFDTPGYAGGVAVRGTYAYLSDGYKGIQIVDVHDPSNPVHVGAYALPGYASHISVENDHAFVSIGWEGMAILDVSDPRTPVPAGDTFTIPTWVENVQVVDGFAFVAAKDEGVYVVDVRTPAAPVLITRYDTPGEAVAVAVAGNRVFIADSQAGLHVARMTRYNVALSGPEIGVVAAASSFTSSVKPEDVPEPLSYTWEATDHEPVVQTNTQTDTISFTWDTPGIKNVRVRAIVQEHEIVASWQVTVVPAVAALPLVHVDIRGATVMTVTMPLTLMAQASPLSATLGVVDDAAQPAGPAVLYVWNASEQERIEHVGGITDTVSFAWSQPGIKTVVVTATNSKGQVYDHRRFKVMVPQSTVAIEGPSTGVAGTTYPFSATLNALAPTLPLTWTWEATGHTPRGITATDLVQHTSFRWRLPGTKVLTVTAVSGNEQIHTTRVVDIESGAFYKLWW